MNLQESINLALALTRELRTSLEAGRVEAWAEILARRETAMAAFQATHQAADAPSRAACQPAVAALGAADRKLRLLAQDALILADEDFRKQLGAAPMGTSAYGDEPMQGAVNRRA